MISSERKGRWTESVKTEGVRETLGGGSGGGGGQTLGWQMGMDLDLDGKDGELPATVGLGGRLGTVVARRAL